MTALQDKGQTRKNVRKPHLFDSRSFYGDMLVQYKMVKTLNILIQLFKSFDSDL